MSAVRAGESPTSRGRAPAAGAALGGARAAVGLLTIVPVGRRPLRADAQHAAAPWLPLVGALVGAAAAGAFALAQPLLGGLYGAALALTVAAIVTGGLHHDGLADTADGLGVRGDRARRLAVMRDSGIGAFGTLAVIAYALLATAALARLSPAEAAAALICGGALGRWAALAQLALLPPARPDGLGATFAATRPALALGSLAALAVALAAALVTAAPVLPGLGAAAAAALAAAATALLARRAVGGRTGDTLGAAVLLTELTVYSTLAACWAG